MLASPVLKGACVRVMDSAFFASSGSGKGGYVVVVTGMANGETSPQCAMCDPSDDGPWNARIQILVVFSQLTSAVPPVG